MATKTRSGATKGQIDFSGPPHRLVATGPVPELTEAEFVPSKALAAFIPEGKSALHIRKRPRFGGALMKLKLARNTPPGTYKAQIKSGGSTWGVGIDVRPHVQVYVSPGELEFNAPPGGRATFVTTLRNLSNIDIQIPKTAPVGIFDDDGVETAFASTYGKKVSDINAFLSSFTEKLADAHGGLMKLTVLKGSGKHAPGAIASLEIAADIPPGAKKGHRYHAVWTTEFANLAISVFATK